MAPAPITTVGLVTRNRPASMIESLESYIENCRNHNRHPEYVVLDDSPSDEMQTKAKASLRTSADRFDARIRYAGTAEKLAFAERLTAESAVPPHVVRFALFGDARCAVTVGANRNALLLDTVDGLVFSADDDTRCRIASVAEDDAVSMSREYDPTEFWFFPDRDSALSSLTSGEIDLLAGHESMLGSGAGIALNGLAGDSGMVSPRYYLSLTGTSRERLTSSEQAYESALRSREVLRTVRRPTISNPSFCMAGFFSFDNRDLIPPFFPVQRNEDGIFGVVRQCTGDGSVGFLPTVLLHAPAPRTFSKDDVWQYDEGIRIADIVIDCLLTRPVDAKQPGELGSHLRWLGSQNLSDFERLVQGVQQQRTLAMITMLYANLQTYASSPGFWADDVKRLIGVLQQAPARAGYIVPRDLPGHELQLSQELVRKFGELLEAWPAIVTSARRLREKGIRLTAAV